MAGVHGLQHVEALAAADFAHYDPVWPHAERIPHNVPNRNFAFALNVLRAAFEADHMLLLQLEFHGILDRHDPVI
jgi:hypothetical protein